MSNLRFIKEFTATSGTTLIQATNIFTNDFEVYKINIYDVDQSGSGAQKNRMRFINSSGSTVTSSDYAYGQQQLKAYSSFGTDQSDGQSYAQPIMDITGSSEIGLGAIIYIFNPTNTSTYTLFIAEEFGFYETAGGAGAKSLGSLKEFSSITGLEFFPASGTYDSFKFRVYGIGKG